MGAKVCKPQLPCGSGLGRLGVEEPSLGLSLFLSPKQLLPTSPAQQGPPVPRLWDGALMAVIQGWPRTPLPWEGLFIQDTPRLSRAAARCELERGDWDQRDKALEESMPKYGAGRVRSCRRGVQASGQEGGTKLSLGAGTGTQATQGGVKGESRAGTREGQTPASEVAGGGRWLAGSAALTCHRISCHSCLQTLVP